MGSAYKRLVQAGAAVAMMGGAMDAVLGVGALWQLGSTVPAVVAAIPELDSQARFYGMIFMGYGALTWLYTRDMQRYAPVLTLLAAAMFLGGCMRFVSMALTGLPPMPMRVLLGLELGLPALLLWMQYRQR
jgi:Domain of unknown function (DUF4345)